MEEEKKEKEEAEEIQEVKDEQYEMMYNYLYMDKIQGEGSNKIEVSKCL